MYTSQVNYEQSDFGYKFVNNYLPPVVENYVARLNGTDQYWQLSEVIPLVGNFRVEADVAFNGLNETDLKVFDSTTGDSKRFDININNYSEGAPFLNARNYMSARVDGVETNSLPNDSLEFSLVIYRGDSEVDRQTKELLYIGARYSIENFLDGYVRNLRIYDENDVLVNEIPLTNKAQGATQLATVGNVNATMIGYTPDVWVLNE